MKNSTVIITVACIVLLNLLLSSIAFHQLLIPVVLLIVSLLGFCLIVLGIKEQNAIAGTFLIAAGLLLIDMVILGDTMAFNREFMTSALYVLLYVGLFCLYVACLALTWILVSRFGQWLRNKLFSNEKHGK